MQDTPPAGFRNMVAGSKTRKLAVSTYHSMCIHLKIKTKQNQYEELCGLLSHHHHLIPYTAFNFAKSIYKVLLGMNIICKL